MAGENKVDGLRACVLAELAAHHVTQATARFDGSGDSGQVSDIEAKAIDGSVVDLNQPCRTTNKVTGIGRPSWDPAAKVHVYPEGSRPMTVHELLEEWIYAALGDASPGWELEDGSFGEIVIVPGEGTIRCALSSRVMTYDETTIEL